MSTARIIIEERGFSVDEVRQFMHSLRDSAVVNMFGSGEYLMREYGVDYSEAKEIVLNYMDDGLGEKDSDG